MTFPQDKEGSAASMERVGRKGLGVCARPGQWREPAEGVGQELRRGWIFLSWGWIMEGGMQARVFQVTNLCLLRKVPPCLWVLVVIKLGGFWLLLVSTSVILPGLAPSVSWWGSFDGLLLFPLWLISLLNFVSWSWKEKKELRWIIKAKKDGTWLNTLWANKNDWNQPAVS